MTYESILIKYLAKAGMKAEKTMYLVQFYIVFFQDKHTLSRLNYLFAL